MSSSTEQTEAEVSALVDKLRSEHPWLADAANCRGRARVAACLRAELKAIHPRTTFRVRRVRDSVVVAWAGGPSSRELAALTAKYFERQSDDNSTPADLAADLVFGQPTFIDLERAGGAE